MSNDNRIQKVYISGKISGIEEEAKVLFDATEETLKHLGYDVINPMTLPHNHDKSWERYMREDLKALLDCDIIFMLHNWKESDGAKFEYSIAMKLGMPIIFENENT
ncbi:MAG: DUF4406 domain-containing protein [Bacteroidia bacterium]